MTAKRFFFKTARILAIIITSILVLVCVTFLFISLPVGKKFVKNRIEIFLQKKLNTKVLIGKLDYALPEWIRLEDVYIEDQSRDTLFRGEEMQVDIHMLKLLRGNTDIEKVYFKNMYINITRKKSDSVFNYQFIMDAFTGNKPSANPDTAALKISLDRLIFENVALNFDDEVSGTRFLGKIGELDGTITRFQPDRLQFFIDDFEAKHVGFFMKMSKPDSTAISLPASEIQTTGVAYPLIVSSNRFTLRNVQVSVKDESDGFSYVNDVRDLHLKNAVFDMGSYLGRADSILLDSSSIALDLPPSPKSNEDSIPAVAAEPWRFAANYIGLTNNAISFDNNAMKKTGGLDFNHLNTTGFNAIINDFVFSQDTTAALVSNISFSDSGGFKLDTAHVRFMMTDTILYARELLIKTPASVIRESFELTYDSLAGITRFPQNTTLTASLKNASLAFNDLYLINPAMKESFPPKDFGNQVVYINAGLQGILARVYIPLVTIKGLGGSSLTARATLYNLTDAEKFSYDLEILDSRIKKTDLLKFLPDESRASFREYPDVIKLTGRLTGDKNNLRADIKTSAEGLALQGKINLSNISDPQKMKYDFDLTNAVLGRKYISGFLPAESLPPGFSLPERIEARGKLKGSKNDFEADLQLLTSYGNITVNGTITNMQNPDKAVYDLVLVPDDFDLGKLLGQDSTFGTVSGKVIAKGRGFDPAKMVSDISLDLQKLEYNNYAYNNISLDAYFDNGIVRSNGSIDDKHLEMRYNVIANVRGKYPTFDGRVRIDTAQLLQLKLYPDTLNFSLTASVDAKSLEPRNLNFTAIIDSATLETEYAWYALDTIALAGTSQNGIDSIFFTSEIANLSAHGAFDYTRIAPAILQYIDHYYNIGKTEPKPITNQQLAIDGNVLPHPLVQELLPGLKEYQKIDFSGTYSSDLGDSALNIIVNIPYVRFNEDYLREGNINISSKNERLNYTIDFDTLNLAANKFYNTELTGGAANDSLSVSLLTRDSKKREWFGLNAMLYVDGPVYTLRLTDDMVLNYEKWTVAGDNFIEYGPKHILVNNFHIYSDTASIKINSVPQVVNSPVYLTIDNFNLRSVSSFISNDTLFAGGILDANLVLSDIESNLPAFTGNASVAGLEIMQQPLGDLQIDVARKSPSEIAASLTLAGAGNDISMKGSYFLNNKEKEFELFATINKLSLAAIQGFTGNQIANASGSIHGSMNLDGKFSDPRWNGEIIFDSTRFTLVQFGTAYRLTDEKIVFRYPDIVFDDFSIRDSLDQELKIRGSLTSNTLSDFELDLRLNANNFTLINVDKAINSELYGIAAVDASLRVTGSSRYPNLEGNVFVKDRTNLTIVLPERSFNRDERKHIVRFVDADTMDILNHTEPFQPAETFSTAFAAFLNYNLNVEITKAAKLNIIVDPTTGDQLTVQGDARLNAGVDPGGNIVLAGHYELAEGEYELNYQFLQRKFKLIKGSTIDFAGDPTDARINITAEYIVNTSARDLVANEVNDVSSNLANSFNQKVPFRVILYLTGELDHPDISFDIQLPEENAAIGGDLRSTIENKLNQLRGDQSATNKQVFSLLLFNRFVGEQSSDFFKGNEGAGGGFADLARQSVSQFMSAALNEIAANLFKGIDIDLNLNSYRDFSNGGNAQRTDLNVAVSKTLMNDRLVVSVGTNVGLEGGNTAAAAQRSSGFSPDLSVAYKLTDDGRYLVRAYRKNQFEVVFDGYVIETGLSFVITMDYDKFREIFGKKK